MVVIGKARLWAVISVCLLAPVTAELLQAYLGDLGGILGLIFVVLFFAPLYGGAALLIREVAVRTGRGWPGRLLLAAAFGVAMPTLVDVSLFTTHRPDIDDWDAIVSGARLGGIGWSPALAWVAGHVLMSVSAPLLIVEQLAREPRPWLGRVGLGVTSLLFVLVATLVHNDQVTTNEVRAGFAQYAVSAGIVVALVLLAFTPVGRPLRRIPGVQEPPAPLCGLVAVAVVALLAFSPGSWLGVALSLAALATGGLLVLRWARAADWGPRHLAALVFGAVLTQTLIGVLAPLPQATSHLEKYTQHALYLLIVLAIGVALERRTRPARTIEA